jgi:hypothetical protein
VSPSGETETSPYEAIDQLEELAGDCEFFRSQCIKLSEALSKVMALHTEALAKIAELEAR